ncbi:PREDICTED: pinin-like isoform X2 [Rhagoletis zephyria]|uniref:pinin-like isoform X2 n=1 Tax=Rhagoletis zephyria TaxID=28612 RepID=UPI00081188A7|nr:PREDICTED: pinin-like isoform X2 [Rhagoletis zephyria]
MDSSFNKSFHKLQKELEEEKCNLDVLNDSIRRIVGRHRDPGYWLIKAYTYIYAAGPKYGSGLKHKKIQDDKSVFKRLSIYDEELKPRLSSRVIRELPTREEVLEAQGTDLESRARNRRMFGSLLGTLHKFCLEESRLKIKEDKKAQIEKKLEEQQLLERETIKKERDFLLTDRKKKQTKIRILESNLNRLKDFATFERSVTNIRYCIRTKTKPFIYYRPYKLCKKTERLISDTRGFLDSELRDQKEQLNFELKEMEREDLNDIDTREKHMKLEFKPSNTSYKIQEVEFKENKSRNLNEPALSSSIIVVKKME